MNKATKVQLKERIVEIKEGKQLIVASTKREDVDLPEISGTHEFSIEPRSMFNVDGSSLLRTDKSSIIHQIEMITSRSEEEPYDMSDTREVVIFDGMALLNQMKMADIQTCGDLATKFIKNVMPASNGYDEIRMIFDRYQEISLKDLTKNK